MTDLTIEQIDAMPAGPEMDAFVAELVMGWKNMRWKEGGHIYPTSWPAGWYGEGPDKEVYLTRRYSTDIAAAWEVVEKLVGNCDERDFFIECWSNGEWFVASGPMEYSSRKPQANCDGKKTGRPSAPLAICRMALKSVLE